MKTKLSSKGQVVLPAAARRRLGLVAGSEMDVVVETDRLVLVPKGPRRPRFRQGLSKATGLPVLEVVDDDAPFLTSEQVAELLADFP